MVAVKSNVNHKMVFEAERGRAEYCIPVIDDITFMEEPCGELWQYQQYSSLNLSIKVIYIKL